MSSPYWSPPTPAERDLAPRWQQPPGAGSAAEPTVELPGEPTGELRTEPTVSFGAGSRREPYPATDRWPRSAVTAPLPHEANPTPYDSIPYAPMPYAPAPYFPTQHAPEPYHPGYPLPAYPLQHHPVAGAPVLWSDRSRAAAGVLAFFLGPLGVHNFYLGHIARGVVQLVLTLTGVGLVISWIWVVVEFVLILTGGLRDRYGRLLR